MTVNDYILQKFQTFSVNLSEADLFDICLNAKISGGGEMNEDCQTRVSVHCEVHPLSIASCHFHQRKRFSMSWNIQGIKDYYSFLCKQYGLKDELGNKPKVTFL